MHDHVSSSPPASVTDRPELTELKEAEPAECRYVVGHGQLTVEQNAKVVNVVCEL